jgi:hypothetical protein
MKDRNYELYETEDFALDKEFARWVVSPDKEKSPFWNNYRESHPEKIRQMDDAILIIRALKPIDTAIPDNKLDAIFEKVKKQHIRRRVLYQLTTYAAVAIILLSIGAIVRLSNNSGIQFPEETIAATTKGKVILSNGTVHEFDTEKTIITQTASGKTAINNDTISGSQKKTGAKDELNQVIIPYGKRSEITLADGTHIVLNSGSKLLYPSGFDKKTREVYLVGEAFFEVAHNAAQPFIVNVHGFKIRVLGTSFNVSSYNEDASIQAVLVTGKISAGKNALFAKTTELNPGERLVYNKSNEETTTDKVDIDLYASWVNGYLLFENEPTPFVFRKLERYYNQKIIVGEGLEKITFSGKLDLKENLNDVLESIAFASKVKITQQNGNYTIN